MEMQRSEMKAQCREDVDGFEDAEKAKGLLVGFDWGFDESSDTM